MIKSSPDLIRTMAKEAKVRVHPRFDELSRQLHDFYDLRFSEHIASAISSQYPSMAGIWNANNAGHRYLPLVRFLVRRMAHAFCERPTLTLQNPDGTEADAAQSRTWRDIIRETKLYSRLRLIDRWLTLFRQPAIGCRFRAGKLKLDVLPPYSYDVLQGLDEPDDLFDARALVLALPTPADAQVGNLTSMNFAVWTPDTYQAVRRAVVPGIDPSEMRIGDGPTYVNPYGRIPYIVARDGEPQPGSFFLPPDEMLAQTQISVCLQQSDIDEILKLQGFGKWILEGMHGKDMPKDWVMSPGVAWPLPEGVKANLVAIRPPVDLTLAAQRQYLKQIALMRHLSPETFSIESKATTALAKAMDLFEEAVERSSRSDEYIELLEDLFDLIRRVHNTHVDRGERPAWPRLDESLRLHVELGDIPQPQDVLRDIQASLVAYQSGRTSPVEDIAREHDIDESEARERWTRNLADARLLGPVQPVPQDGARSDAPATAAPAGQDPSGVPL